jgi:hypothetical protein
VKSALWPSDRLARPAASSTNSQSPPLMFCTTGLTDVAVPPPQETVSTTVTSPPLATAEGTRVTATGKSMGCA